MTVDLGALALYLNANPEEPLLSDLLAESEELVTTYLGADGQQRCPTVTRDLAVKSLASELYARRNAPGGVAQWVPEGQPVRLARDPLVAVKSLLAPYRTIGPVG